MNFGHMIDFNAVFDALTRDEALGGQGYRPMRWQRRLYAEFIEGRIPLALDLPTGLGKTSVMAIWLIAMAHGATLPRRLVYVVDRRAVVDQATVEAERLRDNARAALGMEKLAISTLRGRFVDNREWLADPAAPAIVVGTVDMIGSRLLFSGYGTSPRIRPYHAGLLGADTLVVLDEAHLVPPFQRLLQAIVNGDDTFGAKGEADRGIVPPFRLLPLSATGLSSEQASFCLMPEDRDEPVVAKRLGAVKKLSIDDLGTGQLPERLASEAWGLTENGTERLRCIVYCDRREEAEKVKNRLDTLAKGKRGPAGADTELFVGARRVRERQLARDWLRDHRFLAGSDAALERPAFLVATSAGEVGIDLDADHMVSDLVAWERMVQRLGRVNRRGERGDTEVRVIDSTATEKNERRAAMLAKEHTLLLRLPALEGGRNASPGALLDLRDSTETEEIRAASTPEPLRPALNRALVDAWSMTSLPEHTGRPEVAPWLRGWVDEEPQTTIVWRTHLPVRIEFDAASGREAAMAPPREIEAFFEAAAPHESEKLETEAYRVAGWLQDRAKAALKSKRPAVEESSPDQTEASSAEMNADEPAPEPVPPRVPALQRDAIVALVLSPGGSYERHYSLGELERERKGSAREEFRREIAGKVLVVDARLGGLKAGMLDPSFGAAAEAADTDPGWNTDAQFRVRPVTSLDEPAEEEWRFEDAFVLRRDAEGTPQNWLRVDHLKQDARSEDARSIAKPQELALHQDWARREMVRIAAGVGLSGSPVGAALALAASLHDEGKRALRWQRAFKAPRDAERFGLSGPLAKTRGPIDQALLDGYRHEFGSLRHVEANADFKNLSADWQDLVLHLVAAHHGFARPVIATRGCEDPPSLLEERARDVALRFARLQKRWGPWGLAWLEALLRAADAQASRDNDEGTQPRDPEVA